MSPRGRSFAYALVALAVLIVVGEDVLAFVAFTSGSGLPPVFAGVTPATLQDFGMFFGVLGFACILGSLIMLVR